MDEPKQEMRVVHFKAQTDTKIPVARQFIFRCPEVQDHFVVGVSEKNEILLMVLVAAAGYRPPQIAGPDGKILPRITLEVAHDDKPAAATPVNPGPDPAAGAPKLRLL